MSFREKLLKQQSMLKKLRVSCDSGEIAGIMSETGQLVPFSRSMSVLDSQTPASGTVGIAFHNYLDPKTIKVLLQPLKVVEAFGREVAVGNWETEVWVKSATEHLGDTQNYSDYTAGKSSDSNRIYIRRSGYRHEATMMYGELEVALASAEKYNIVSEERSAQMYAINARNNKIAFYGVKDQNTFGVLNDPSLRTSLVAPKLWKDATYDEIKSDIFAMIADIVRASGENVSLTSDSFVLVISGETYIYLAESENQYGKTLLQRLKEAFSNIEFRTAPQLAQPTGNIAELRCTSIVGDEVWEFGYGQKLRLHTLVVDTSHSYQKASSQTFGAILNYPVLVSRMVGV
ncbi:MAG: major capsid family protein [Cetobacterium sp.]